MNVRWALLLAQQRREQEKRVKRSLERAQAPVHNKLGKPVMFRSRPLQRKKRSDDSIDKKTGEEEELQNWLASEF